MSSSAGASLRPSGLSGWAKREGAMAERYARTSGVDAVSCDASQPIAWIKERLQSLVPVQGNLDPLLLVAGGPQLDRRVSSSIMRRADKAPSSPRPSN